MFQGYLLGEFAQLSVCLVCRFVSPCLCMKLLRSHCKEFYEIWYLIIFRNMSGKLKFY